MNDKINNGIKTNGKGEYQQNMQKNCLSLSV
jgi:hypothetical protein